MARDEESRLVYSTGGEVASGKPKAPKTMAGRARATGGKGIRIAVEQRAAGRVVTVVRGIAGGEAALAELARDLKAACGAGGTVRGDVIELQGDHRAAVQAHLATRGLRSRY